MIPATSRVVGGQPRHPCPLLWPAWVPATPYFGAGTAPSCCTCASRCTTTQGIPYPWPLRKPLCCTAQFSAGHNVVMPDSLTATLL